MKPKQHASPGMLKCGGVRPQASCFRGRYLTHTPCRLPPQKLFLLEQIVCSQSIRHPLDDRRGEIPNCEERDTYLEIPCMTFCPLHSRLLYVAPTGPIRRCRTGWSLTRPGQTLALRSCRR